MELLIALPVVAVVSLWALARATPRSRQRRQLSRAKLWPIGELPEDTLGRLIGTVRAVEPTLTAPLSGRACVCYAVSVSGPELMTIREAKAVSFLLEDGSGRALVDAEGAELERRDPSYIGTSGQGNEPSERERAFLARHGAEWRGRFVDRSFSYHEALVEVAETICVAGTGTRAGDPYRTAAPTRLRLASSLITDAPTKR